MIGANTWQLLSPDTFKDGGPSRVYDHQVRTLAQNELLCDFDCVDML